MKPCQIRSGNRLPISTAMNSQKAIVEGVRRIEDIIKGQAAGLTEGQFREALRDCYRS